MKKTKHKKNKHISEDKSQSKTCGTKNTWMITSIVLGVLLVISLVLAFTGTFAKETTPKNILTQEEAETKATEFVTLLGEVEGIPLNLNEVKEQDGVYSVDVEFMGQQNSFYMSMNGDLFFLQGITLNEIREIQAQMELAEQQQETEQETNEVNVNLEDANILGSGDVLMIEYSSATCPFCARYAQETFPLINDEYIESEDITYVYKHFIRNDVDVLAANAMECAGEQGAFFEYKNLIYNNQNMLSQQTAYVTWAEQLDLVVDDFTACFEDRRYTAKANAETQEGQSNGVTGTPGFIINSRLVAGAQPFANFQTIIDAELAN